MIGAEVIEPVAAREAVPECVVRLYQRGRRSGDVSPPPLSSDLAYRMVLFGLERALSADQPQTIVVVNAHGETLAVGSTPAADPQAQTVAANKAFTACTVGLDTARLAHGELMARGKANALVNVIAGGAPIRRGATVVGGIGVSGGDADCDHATAKAAQAAAADLMLGRRRLRR